MSQILAVTPVAAPVWTARVLLVGCFADEAPPEEGLPPSLVERARAAIADDGWKARKGQRREVTGVEDVGTLVLVGLGKREELESRSLGTWLGDQIARARKDGLDRIALWLPDHELTRGASAVERLATQAIAAAYRFQEYQTKEDTEGGPQELLLGVRDEDEARGVGLGREVGAAATTARRLADTPPNVANPAWMAEQAAALAKEHGLRIEVLEPAELERLGMGGILAVGGGSASTPRLVKLEWRGTGSARVALVGKGVTFDTGGISIKPSKDMDEMKWDKCGACAVLGAMEAAARLGVAPSVTAYLPLAENMPSGTSYRPSDIVTCYNGKTVEVLNTDAEGRMILADALAWAAEDAPDHLVELSTLTGACVVALGQTGAGLYTPDDALAAGLCAAAGEAGERLWRMPLWPEFREAIEGQHADLENIGGRWGGASIAAAFLSHFVGDVASWAHLDIAGPAYTTGDAKGATGYGVATLTRWLRSLG